MKQDMMGITMNIKQLLQSILSLAVLLCSLLFGAAPAYSGTWAVEDVVDARGVQDSWTYVDVGGYSSSGKKTPVLRKGQVTLPTADISGMGFSMNFGLPAPNPDRRRARSQFAQQDQGRRPAFCQLGGIQEDRRHAHACPDRRDDHGRYQPPRPRHRPQWLRGSPRPGRAGSLARDRALPEHRPLARRRRSSRVRRSLVAPEQIEEGASAPPFSRR